jgi:putative ABC transport system substrate-binding protein
MRLRVVGLIVTLALGILATPLAADGQGAGAAYRVGFLSASFFGFPSSTIPGWLQELGYVQGRNIAFEHRFAPGRDDRLPELAAELVSLKVDVIVTAGTPAILAASEATRTIPIVIVATDDPVRAGLVASLERPGGNVTGIVALSPGLGAKRLTLLRKVVPGVTRMAVLWNPATPDNTPKWRETQVAAQVLGVELLSLEVRSLEDVESAFRIATTQRVDALLVFADPLIARHAHAITELATQRRLPAMYETRHFVDGLSGNGLISYGPSSIDLSRRVAAYVDMLLKGASPAELPIEQAWRNELVVNLKTAKTLGLAIPQSVLILADKVIE